MNKSLSKIEKILHSILLQDMPPSSVLDIEQVKQLIKDMMDSMPKKYTYRDYTHFNYEDFTGHKEEDYPCYVHVPTDEEWEKWATEWFGKLQRWREKKNR